MIQRRQFLQNALIGAGGLAASSFLGCSLYDRKKTLASIPDNYVFNEALQIYHPKNHQVRVIAESGKLVGNSSYIWHAAPDGGACFATEDDGWIYVSNSELPSYENNSLGGVGAIRFNKYGEIEDAYSILQNTRRNCAGGKTPWQTWLSCEENNDSGWVYECDPFGKNPAKKLASLGAFNHEAVAFDDTTGYFYLTEDKKDGCLYRIRARSADELENGILEVGVHKKANVLTWIEVPDPSASEISCRYQVEHVVQFKGGEGIATQNGIVYFSTKKDNKVWALKTSTSEYWPVYDPENHHNPILTGVDNIEISANGEILVAEDGGDMQIVVMDHKSNLHPLVTIIDQDKSEICGPAFNPDQSILYFSSQRGATGRSANGITYALVFPNG